MAIKSRHKSQNAISRAAAPGARSAPEASAVAAARAVLATRAENPAKGPATTLAATTAGKKVRNGTPLPTSGVIASRSSAAMSAQARAAACPRQNSTGLSRNCRTHGFERTSSSGVDSSVELPFTSKHFRQAV